MSAAFSEPTPLLGCDFSSSPSRRKPIVLAWGERHGSCVLLARLERFDTLDAWGAWLAQPGRWVGGFDLPFGLPRELVEQLGWPRVWQDCMAYYRSLTRGQIRSTFAAFCDGRPVGGKFAHRATDGPAGSSPSMKWVNPPVAFMLHAGVPLLRNAGVAMPGLHPGDTGNRDADGQPSCCTSSRGRPKGRSKPPTQQRGAASQWPKPASVSKRCRPASTTRLPRRSPSASTMGLRRLGLLEKSQPSSGVGE